MTFVYLPKVQTFLARKIDENPEYAQSIRVFEFVVGRNKRIGDPFKKFLPISLRVFKAIVPGTETLAFVYYFEGRKGEEVIKVIEVKPVIELLDD